MGLPSVLSWPSPIHTSLVPPRKPGVYALYLGKECIYVGSSISLRERLGNHDYVGRFDSIQWSLHPAEDLEDIEKEWIFRLQPPLNRVPVRRPRLAPKAWAWNTKRQDWEKVSLGSILLHQKRGVCTIVERIGEGRGYSASVIKESSEIAAFRSRRRKVRDK